MPEIVAQEKHLKLSVRSKEKVRLLEVAVRMFNEVQRIVLQDRRVQKEAQVPDQRVLAEADLPSPRQILQEEEEEIKNFWLVS